MAVLVSGVGGADPRAGVLLDLVESWQGFGNNTANVNAPCDNRGTSPQDFGTTAINPLCIFNNVSNAPQPTMDVAGGNFRISWPLAGGSSNFRYGQRGVAGIFVLFPVFQRFGLAGSVPFALRRPRRQYTVTHLMRITVDGSVRDLEFGIAGTNQGVAIQAQPTGEGVVWSSKAALNGGNWTPQLRPTNAGALVTGTDSTVPRALNTWHAFGIRYTEGLIPTLEWLLDLTPRFQVAGEAAMPSASAASDGYGCFQGGQQAVGTTIEVAETRFQVVEI